MNIDKYEVIEELAHAVDLGTTVYKDWALESDDYNYVIVERKCNNITKRAVVQASNLHGNQIVVALFANDKLVIQNTVPAHHALTFTMLVPMIEQHLNGDRAEVKSALADLVNISPAIN
jgi:hypothetical protein